MDVLSFPNVCSNVLELSVDFIVYVILFLHVRVVYSRSAVGLISFIVLRFTGGLNRFQILDFFLAALCSTL